MYTDLRNLHREYPDHTLLNGTNRDDFGDYRPGLQAADEHNIQSPLADCGLGKTEVRALALHFELPNWNKPASPCLSSRVPYGSFITTEKLKQIEEAEGILNQFGFEEVRVRHYGKEARLEVPSEQITELRTLLPQIQPALQQIGFDACHIDDEGLVSGKLNRVLKNVPHTS